MINYQYQKMGSNKLLIPAVLFFISANAQQSAYYNNKEEYRHQLAEDLFQTKVYNASKYEYARAYYYNRSLDNSKKEASEFYEKVISVMLQREGAAKGLDAFIKQYPNSALFATASMPLADYYLQAGKYVKALETLKDVNQFSLSKEENTEYVLKLGYAMFMTGDSQGAKEALNEVYTKSSDETRKDVAYMLGHLHYQDGENQEAFAYFDEIKNEPKFSKLVRPYYVQLYYNNNEYGKAIEEGNNLLQEDIGDSYRAEVHKIIGESYFKLGDYQSAESHLKEYLDYQTNPSESDLYQMGFVLAESGNYNGAVSYYNQLINNQSSLAQNAYYQLGNAYLQTGSKQQALSAFRSAYQMTYDPSVKKLAHKQYAKLSYDLGNPFEPAPRVIKSYVDTYPSASDVKELNELLVKSYLYSGSYRETLKAIDELSNSTPQTDKIDQEVSFLLGTEEYNKGNYDEAERFLLRSLEHRQNPEIYNRALYWVAQTYYQKGNFPSAITRLESLKGQAFLESKQLNYDLGYAYFKSGKFSEAKQYFEAYLQDPDPAFKDDASLRLADTYYAANNLNEAIALYDKVPNASDYTMYQKAMAIGFKGDSVGKISALESMISSYPQSEYVDDAQFEIGVAHASNEDFAKSNSSFSKVEASSKDQDLVARAKIYQAQNLVDQNQMDKARAAFEKLGQEYKGTSYATLVVQAARPLYIASGDLSGYQAFAGNLGVSIDKSDIEDLNLSVANQNYAAKQYSKAIPLFEKYLAENPSSTSTVQVQYQLGESYYQTKAYPKAKTLFESISKSSSSYKEDAQTRLAQIYIMEGDTNNAEELLEELSSSSTPAIKQYAQVELLKIYAEQGDLNKASQMADLVMANSKNAPATLQQARAIKARSQMKSGKDSEAQKAYQSLENSSNVQVAAEALYAKAYYQNKAKNYKASNETIFKLANNYASEEYWGAKSLVVMAKNYLGLKDNYQASYTVDQIIANYQDFPDVVAEAREVKKQIK